MTGYSDVQWLISNRDFRVHCFHHASGQYLEALCSHSVPPDEIVDPATTALTPPKCTPCLIEFGQRMTNDVQRWLD